MTVEERIEAHDRQIAALISSQQKTEVMLARLANSQAKTEALLAQVVESIHDLAAISHRHEEELIAMRREFQAYLNRLPPQ